MAMVGLKFDLSAWKKGVRDAAELVRRGITGALLRPFDRAVKGMFGRMRSALSGMRLLIGTIVSGVLAGKVLRFLGEAIGLSRELDDSMKRIELAARNAGNAFDISRVRAFTRQLALAFGVRGAEVNAVFARFASTFSEEQSRALTRLTVDVAAQYMIPFEEAQRLVMDATMGRVTRLQKMGISVEQLADRTETARNALAALYGVADGAAGATVNANEKLAAAWEQLKTSIGEMVQPALDRVQETLTAIIWGAQGSDLEGTFGAWSENLSKVGSAGLQVLGVLTAVYKASVAWTSTMFSGIMALWDVLSTLFTKTLPTLLARGFAATAGLFADIQELLPDWAVGKEAKQTARKQANALDEAATGMEAENSGLLAEAMKRGTRGVMQNFAMGLDETMNAFRAAPTGGETFGAARDKVNEMADRGRAFQTFAAEDAALQAGKDKAAAGSLVSPVLSGQQGAKVRRVQGPIEPGGQLHIMMGSNRKDDRAVQGQSRAKSIAKSR